MSIHSKPSKKWPFVLLALNVIGVIAYVFLASHGWVIPQECEAAIHTITGEPYVWFISIAPVIAVYSLLDIAWAAMILKHRQWHTGLVWLAAVAIWIMAAIVDFSHHQC